MENFVSEKVYFKWNNHLTSVLLVVFFPENLGLTTPDYYNYLNQTGTYTVDGTDDVQELKDTLVSTGNLHVYWRLNFYITLHKQSSKINHIFDLFHYEQKMLLIW